MTFSAARHRLLATALALALLPFAAACGGESSAAEGTGGGKVTLRIGDQGQSLLTTLKVYGQLKNLPYDVKISQFDSGPLVNQGLQAGVIDFGVLGDTPAVLAQASGIPAKVVSVTRTVGPGYTLVARAGSGITSIGDLKGKKIAFSKNTANHGFLLRVLDKAGLKQKDITPVDVPLQNVGNVLESGTVDAATVSEETRAKYLQAHPDAVQVINGRTVTPGYAFRIATDKALADPAKRKALLDFAQRLSTANTWIAGHRDAWVQAYYVKIRKQTPALGRQVFEAVGRTSYVPVDDAVIQAQQKQADLFTANGQLPGKVDLSGQFDPSVSRDFNARTVQKGSSS
ncbi:MetQ/NlpA family ABC transporter substrate-binding protein [Streptomyces beijiangensis]|uniref:PhnD/SsuA/transferrin family substrate-binding protein n=1 Tax=Streptomyces beijiangensis TaxID=163361 RepID=A0A939F9B0_9ACTN|nr:MetQ/NlpA family ABC transporter substrate-binding protein [Streptomyces beijiangensis]MBO0514034.1 PhnD/SsuA/transferrin family substrate-binding protein [Streptomyces beijiangensis]